MFSLSFGIRFCDDWHFWPNVQHARYVPENETFLTLTLLTLALLERLAKKIHFYRPVCIAESCRL